VFGAARPDPFSVPLSQQPHAAGKIFEWRWTVNVRYVYLASTTYSQLSPWEPLGFLILDIRPDLHTIQDSATLDEFL
jgi:hypothetical protein